MKTAVKLSKKDIFDFIETLEKDSKQKEKMNQAIQKEACKLKKGKDTKFAGMFLSAVKF